MPFERLHPLIRQRLVSQGMVTPTKAQKKAIPEILNGSNVLLIAPTGIGKTEAAVLPVFHNFLLFRDEFQKAGGKGNPPGINILYITPLRALNRDMLRRMKVWGEALDIKVAVRHGDTTQYERTKQSKNPPNFLITTPETVQIMLTGKNLRGHLARVKWVIVDEIHEMATDERGAQLSVALERIYERANEFQRIGLSATVGDPKKVAFFLTGHNRHISIVKIDSVSEKEVIIERPLISEAEEELAEKLRAWPELIAALKRAKELVGTHNSTLFFVNTRDTAEVISSRMGLYAPELKMGIHHGSLSKAIRVEMEERFKQGELKALICTSSMELGIDVGRMDQVIQYNSPRQVERFLQRMGRAGHRTDLVSRGVILAVGPDEVAESMIIGKKAISEELEGVEIRFAPLDVCANQIAALTMEYGNLNLKKGWEIIKRSYPFKHLKEDAFLQIVDELSRVRVLWSDGQSFGKGGNSITYFYNNISMIPDQKTYLIRDITTRKIVGTLDEAFAIGLEDRGTFIIRGNNWNLVKLDEGEVLVEPAPNLGILPDWVGEDIPVPFSIANEVGYIRRVLAEKTIPLEELLKEYPITEDAMGSLRDYIDRQISEGISVPNDQLVTVENGGKLCIVNACFGSKVNETLGQLLSALVSARLGAAVRFTTDPYRVIMESSRRIDPKEVVEALRTFPPNTLRAMLCKVLKNS
ncbi:MAG: DEAD/DEAH box helicase, partial [Thermoplasmata archaeon]|nr:DEAD/DEAH box helicase [Thermoplasmata archaeon]